MTASTTALNSAPPQTPVQLVPKLGRLWRWMMVFALAVHVAGLAWFVSPPAPADSAAGGGGRVLGRLSINLAGSAEPDASGVEAQMPDTTEQTPDPVTRNVERPTRTTTPKAIKRPKTKPIKRDKALTQASKPPKPQIVAKSTNPTVRKPDVRLKETAPTESTKPAAPSARAASTSLGKGASAPTSGAGSAIDGAAQAHSAYLAMLREKIEKNRRYPASARRRGTQGTATVSIVISATGSVSSASLKTRSGSFALDREATRMIQRAAPFPPPPTAPFTVVLPIVFELGR